MGDRPLFMQGMSEEGKVTDGSTEKWRGGGHKPLTCRAYQKKVIRLQAEVQRVEMEWERPLKEERR